MRNPATEALALDVDALDALRVEQVDDLRDVGLDVLPRRRTRGLDE